MKNKFKIVAMFLAVIICFQTSADILAASIVSPAKSYSSPRYGVVVTADKVGVNVRTGPSTNYKKITTIPENYSVKATGQNKSGSWLYIVGFARNGKNYKALKGWVSWSYIEIDA